VIYLLIAALFTFFAFSSDHETFLALYTCIIVFDGFSQLSGQLFGRHNLAPRISPGKTVEGLAGGLIMMAIVAGWIAGEHFLAAWALALAAGLLALAGDLLASKLKRLCGVKDFSNALPGHGGVLDRFDSFMMACAGAMLIAAVIA
jgi:phosphatidate cytidylyltransferase